MKYKNDILFSIFGVIFLLLCGFIPGAINYLNPYAIKTWVIILPAFAAIILTTIVYVLKKIKKNDYIFMFIKIINFLILLMIRVALVGVWFILIMILINNFLKG